MLSRYTNDYIEEIIKSVMDTVKMNLELRQDHSGVNMSYNFIGNYIGVDFERLLSSWEETHTSISLESFIKVLTIHELGHAADRLALLESLERTIEIFQTKKRYILSEIYNDRSLLAMLIEEHEMNITFEQTAWVNAEQVNQKYNLVHQSTFRLVKKLSLESYQKLYLEDLKLYENQLENLNEKTA